MNSNLFSTTEILKPISEERIGSLENLFAQDPVERADSDDSKVEIFRPTPTLRYETNQIRFSNPEESLTNLFDQTQPVPIQLSYDSASALPERADAFGVPTATAPVTATFDNNIDGLLYGVKWASTSISFSFTDSIDDYEVGYPNRAYHAASFQTLNATQRAVVRAWLGSGGASSYYNVSLLSPSELTGASDRDATIRLAMSNVVGITGVDTAFAYYPGNTVEAGDAWFNRTSYNNPVIGTYAYHAFGHELGHALGLKHGHEGGGVRGVAMNADRDSMEFSIMTYRSYVGASTSGGYTNEAGGYAQSLMMYDIAAIQHMYGAWFGYNSSNTTYTFSTTTGEMFVNGVGQGTPFANRIFRTIWDGNGIDTYDFSNYTTNLSIDLTPGGWSDLHVGGNNQRANLGDGHYARGHVFNALQYNGDARSLIENANGGSGNDVIKGNAANNVLNGNGGNDTIYGYGGNDYLYGGIGNDILDGGTGNDAMIGGLGNDTYYVDSMSDTITELAGEGTDLVYSSVSTNYKWLPANVENLTLTGSAYYGDGNDLNNTIKGTNLANSLYGYGGNDKLYGYGSDDYLYGHEGNDTLDGGTGNDSMSGGLGNDTYYVNSMSDTITELAGEGTDLVYSSVSTNVEWLPANVENLTLTGSAYFGDGNSLNNTIKGTDLANALYGYAGNDKLYGYGGNDYLYGGAGNDTIDGGDGNDLIYLGDGNDYLNVSSLGNDTFYGGNGDDYIYGYTGNETYYGEAGNDTLLGWSGNDILVGGSENDSLTGGSGIDTLWGGTGADKFVFNYLSEGIDIIKDFQWTEVDKIQVSGSGFGASSLDQFSYNSSTGGLFFDPVGAVGWTQFTTIENKPAGFSVYLDVVIV